MFETGRRSAISSSELGLYSDRADRYNSSKYSSVVKKFVIVVMAIVAVILAAIFVYDFASGTSASSKVSQETKHIYILQNALKKPSNLSRRLVTTTLKPEAENLTIASINERSDDDVNSLNFIDSTTNLETKEQNFDSELPESRAQTLENLKLRQSLLESAENDNVAEEDLESKQLFDNHAVVYRVRQMYHHDDNDDEEIPEETRPAPFHFKFQNPTPTSFHRSKFPQLTQYRYPYASRNIQDIIKYLTNNVEGSRQGIKFTGVYVNPKKYDMHPGFGEMIANTDKSEFVYAGEDDDMDGSESSSFPMMHGDPFFPYKPKHPADVNLLAPSNVRFSPSGIHRYNPYFESYMQRPIMMRPPPSIEQSYDSSSSYSPSYGKKRKPKPFSVMLDIYPITEINDPPNKKVSRPRPITSMEDYSPDLRRPLRGGKYHASQTQPIPVVAFPANPSATSDDEEKQQMVFHLNLYPRRKNKLSRKDILQRSEMIRPEEHQQFVERVMSPLDAITKQLADHSTIEESKLDDQEAESEASNSELTKYEESFLEMPNEDDTKTSNLPLNHKQDERESNVTEIAQINELKTFKTLSHTDIDSVEGFEKFADGLVATD